MSDQALWPLLVYSALVIAVVAAMIVISYVLGERHREKTTGHQFESGMVPTGTSQIRFSAHFYLIGMLFVIFDLEAVFIIAWAVAARELGWLGYIEILVFTGFLLIALIYLWRMRCFDIFGKKMFPDQKAGEDGN